MGVRRVLRYILPVLLGVSGIVKGQVPHMPAHRIIVQPVDFDYQLRTEATYYSPTLPISFINPFVFGGNLPASTIENSLNLLEDENRLFGQFEVGIKAGIVKDTTSRRNKWLIELSQQQLGRATFQKDLFQLIFQGNTPLEGKTVSGSQLGVRYWNQTALQLWRRLELHQGDLDIGLSVGSVRGYTTLDLDNYQVFTAEFGEYVDFAGELSLQQASSGVSTGISVLYRPVFGGRNLEVSLSNLGVSFFSGDSIDRSLNFDERLEPVEVDNIFELGSTDFDVDQQQFLDTNSVSASNKLVVLNPFRIQASCDVWKGHAGASNRLIVNAQTTYIHSFYKYPSLLMRLRYERKDWLASVSAEHNPFVPVVIGGSLGWRDYKVQRSGWYRKLDVRLFANALGGIVSPAEKGTFQMGLKLGLELN